MISVMRSIFAPVATGVLPHAAVLRTIVDISELLAQRRVSCEQLFKICNIWCVHRLDSIAVY